MSNPLILGTNSIKDTGYDVANSLRFNGADSEDLERTPSSSGNNNKNTVSVWLKRARVDEEDFIIYGEDGSTNRCKITFKSNNQLQVTTIVSSSNNLVYETNRLFRDTSSWYHFVFAFDSTLSTSGDRCRVYVNGTEEDSFAVETDMGQNTSNTLSTSGKTVYIGSQNSGNFFDGYMAEFVFIDGQQLDPTSFGEFDSDSPNIWKPIDVSGLTFGTNGFYLDFENASSLGADVSGNSNNFTVNNLTSVDQSTDTCTNNFCTFNSLVNVPYSTYSEGNLFVDVTSTGNSSHHTNYGNIAFSSGKWYWEAKALGGTKYTIGLSDANNQSNYQQVAGTNLIVGNHANSYISGDAIGYYFDAIYKNGSSVASSLHTIVTNDIMMVAVDADNGKIYFGVNGTWRVANSTTFDPAQNDTTFTTGEFYVSAFSNEDCDWSVNWGSPAYSISSGNSDAEGFGNFEYPVPSGYFALCTKNLSEYG